jgi:hypothetical protein
VDKSQKRGVQLVIARGHAAKLLEAAEEPLDGLALGATHGGVWAGLAPFAAGCNHGHGAALGQGSHEWVGIVAAVGNQVGRGPFAEQGQGLRRVVALARGEAAADEAATTCSLLLKPPWLRPKACGPFFLRAPEAYW